MEFTLEQKLGTQGNYMEDVTAHRHLYKSRILGKILLTLKTAEQTQEAVLEIDRRFPQPILIQLSFCSVHKTCSLIFSSQNHEYG